MQKQHLTPAGMPNNEIGAPTIAFELKSRRRRRFALWLRWAKAGARCLNCPGKF
jgi:hypothetical protein